MYSPMWFLTLVSLLMMDFRTGAIQQKDEPRRCYLCVASNTTSCDQPSSVTTVECAGPCATVAVAPNFTSSLQCAAAAARAPCSLNYSGALQLTCLCDGHLCNAPLPTQLTNDLLNFSANLPNKTADLTQTFFEIYSSANLTDELFKPTTKTPLNITAVTTVSTTTVTAKTTVGHNENEMAPRAEPLKQATAPSDDDEDESEGSGAYEETRSQRHPASAPAAPSSFLPANENKSPPLFTHLFLTTPFIMYVIV
ncbi:uncharacterized protein LOC128678450 [Plodia interpunctella]|uniref:uncharacterized protein LOC128678450 n=1 Tax=Plodia interpunctella TaxID=58824 RepID=UPI00236780E8|nr:uncharacterized protein LOC128678450 [Plodia interpunctella]XP_053615996.1 uncharacterized protein LOC128678450 [Plodia interpunctella]XP_053615997.1 uncharacterized protein LOC128678450 [Plodia interpunctella]